MLASRKSLSGLALALILAAGPAMVWAHGGSERTSEVAPGEARLFVADADNGDLVAIDLPSGAIAARLSTPPFIMSIALSADQRHVYAMRGRNTDRDWITVVATGATDIAGELRPPVIARTIPVDTPGPGSENRTVTVGGKDALLLEGSGEILVIDDGELTGFGDVGVRRYPLAAPDHYFYLEAEDSLYIGHLRKGYVQVLDGDSGAEVTRIEGCPLLHGRAKDEVSARLFYACMRDIMVIGTRGDERNRIVARIPYPEEQRVGAFYHGPGQILWAYTEGTLPIIYRLDAAAEPYALQIVPLDSSIRQWSAEDGEFLLSLTRGGVLQIRDGANGAVRHSPQICGPLEEDYHEHTDKAILPDITSLRGQAFVSLPHEGRIAVVDLATGDVERYLDIGGQPTRMVVVDALDQ